MPPPDDEIPTVWGDQVAFVDAFDVGADRLLAVLPSIVERLSSGSVVMVHTNGDAAAALQRSCGDQPSATVPADVVSAFDEASGVTLAVRVR